jgi:protein-tyrosine phosphatase
MAELLIRDAVDARDLIVSSAGVHALVGQPMDPAAAAAMRELGLRPADHRARQFEPAMAATADLILTAERYHLEVVLQQAPTALRRTFTIREFARLATHLQPGTPQQVIAQAAVARGLVPRPKDPQADDIADPHGQPVEVSRAAAAELRHRLGVILAALGPEATEPKRRPLPYRR